MYRLMIVVSRGPEAGLTSQVVEFSTKQAADSVAEQLKEEDKRYERHSIIVLKLYSAY